MRIEQEGVSIDCFAPHRQYTRRIIRAIRDYPEDYIRSLRQIPSSGSFVVRLREAYYTDPKSSYKGRRIARTRDFLEVHPRKITATNLETLVLAPFAERLIARNFRAELFLVRYFTLEEVVGSENFAGLVASAAEKMLPFLEFALHHAGDPKAATGGRRSHK